MPTCLAVAPQSGLQFGLYSLFTQMLGNWVKRDDDRLGYGVITVQVESCWMKSPVDSLFCNLI